MPEGQAAVLDAALDRALVRSLGALPALLPLCEQVGLREIVNRHCYPEGAAPEDLDVGTVTLILVLNRLQAPQALVHVEEWVGQSVLPEVLGIEAGQCNDDRLARTLDTLLPHLDGIWQDLVVAAITRVGVDLSALCYDITSISFCGAYDEAELVRYGYSRDHRPDRKQIERAATVAAAGRIPVDYRPLAGNVADRTTPVEQLRRVQGLLTLLPRRQADQPCLVISDRAMLTDAALAAYAGSGLCYLGPLDPGVGRGAVRDLLASVAAEELAAQPLPYRPQRAAKDPDWEAYCGVERPLTVLHPDPARPPASRARPGGVEPGEGPLGRKPAPDAPAAAGAVPHRPRQEGGHTPLHHRGHGAQTGGRPVPAAPGTPPGDDHRERRSGHRRAGAADLAARRGGAGASSGARWALRPGDERPGPGRGGDAGAGEAARCAGEALRAGQRAVGGTAGLRA